MCQSVKEAMIGPDNGLSPIRLQAMIWTNAGIMLIWPLWMNFSTWVQFESSNVICKISAILSWSHYSHIENPSWVPVRNEVHPSEFVFQKSRVMASDFCGIQTHEGEVHSARSSIIDSISFTMFFPVTASQRHGISLSNHRKSQSETGNHSWVWKKS